jgi:BirA family biotin operon repressor/biotin-[acetyl-CoA-carboxylase] ligase
MTFFAAVAVAKTIEDLYNLSAEIKWPNDVLIKGKKVCGVLLETSTTDSLVNFVVVGIGINTNIDHSSFSEDLETATSLKEELQKEVNNATLLKTLLEKLEYYYAMFLENESELVEEWKRFDCTLGTNIEVVDPNERFEGRAIDVDDDGALLVKIENGSVRRVLSSSIVLRKPKS